MRLPAGQVSEGKAEKWQRDARHVRTARSAKRFVYLQIFLKINGYIEILLMLIKIYLVITMRSRLWRLLLYYL